MIGTKHRNKLAIAKTLIPLDWDPSSDDAFNAWAQHIHTQARMIDEPALKPKIDQALANKMIQMKNLVLEARKIVSNSIL